MTEYEAILNTECRKVMQIQDRRGIIRKVVHEIRRQIPEIGFSNTKIGTHVNIGIGVVENGGLFRLKEEMPNDRKPEAKFKRDDTINSVLDAIHNADKRERRNKR